jgi:predicted PurR-regulated permease PerM
MAARTTDSIRRWIVFGGCVLVVAVLDWAEPVLVPIAIAFLLTFLLNPPVTWLQHGIGRPAAVIVVVSFTCLALTALAWGLTRQVTTLASELPAYRQNIRSKVADIRNASRGGAVETVQTTLEEIKREMEGGTKSEKPAPVAIVSESPIGLSVPTWLTALSAPLGMAAVVVVLAIFMLIEHRDMRDRLAKLIGQGYLATTTKALEEAATRVSRYLLMQSVVNLIYGGLVLVGLWLLDVPYPLLWASMGAALRFIPYAGPVLAAAGPILVTLAALPGWTQPLYVIGLFIAIELFTNLVLETVLYAGAAGVTQVALIIAVAFWTWLWGPLGLLLATPLTVCLVVLGKHVPGLRFISTLMADEPALTADAQFYQRLLAGDRGDARDVLLRQLKTQSPEEIFDSMLVPALTYAERDRLAGGLSMDEERAVGALAFELVDAIGAEPRTAPGSDDAHVLRVFGYPVESASDEIALHLLERLLGGLPIAFEIASSQMLIAEMIAAVRQGAGVVCLADLPPSEASKTRFILKRLKQMAPDVVVLVGRWGPQRLADDEAMLMTAGASHVARTLIQTRNHLRELAAAIVPPSTAVLPEPSLPPAL